MCNDIIKVKENRKGDLSYKVPNEKLKGELTPSEKNNLANGASRRMIKSNMRIRIKDF